MNRLTKSLIRGSIIGLAIGAFLNYYPMVDELQIDESEILVPYGSFSYNYKSFGHTIRLLSNDSACSGVVIDDHYALTAAHCVTGLFQKLNTKKIFYVYDENGQPTDTIAKPVAAHIVRDVALLSGDFVNFNYAKVDYMGVDHMEVGDELLSCGFPSAQELIYCVKWQLTGSYDFRHIARGVVIQKGCSGGPVFNKYGNVIGVNSAVYGEDFLIGPMVGIFNEFGIEPR